MTIIEETDSEHKSELKLWENTDHNIWLEVGYFDPEDYLSTHGIVLTKDDARALIKELTQILNTIGGEQPKSQGAQLTITPERPIQKVNWSK